MDDLVSSSFYTNIFAFIFSLVFRMVEAEEEYVEQLEILISCFLRPFKMAASSKNPPCTHEDINSIFLNSETVLFLHQIFLKGKMSKDFFKISTFVVVLKELLLRFFSKKNFFYKATQHVGF